MLYHYSPKLIAFHCVVRRLKVYEQMMRLQVVFSKLVEDLSQGEHLVRCRSPHSKTALVFSNKGFLQWPQSLEQDTRENFASGIEEG